MHIFKLAGRVALRHRGLLALYVLMMAAFGFLMAFLRGGRYLLLSGDASHGCCHRS